jgi:hypothetical protein
MVFAVIVHCCCISIRRFDSKCCVNAYKSYNIRYKFVAMNIAKESLLVTMYVTVHKSFCMCRHFGNSILYI